MNYTENLEILNLHRIDEYKTGCLYNTELVKIEIVSY